MRLRRKEIVAIILLIVLIVAVGAYVWFQSEQNAEMNAEVTGSLVDDGTGRVAYTDLDGNPVSLDAYKGRIRVVNVWASWCPFCVDELPEFKKAAEAYDEEDVVFIAINRMERNEKAKAFLEKVGNLDGVVFIQDPNDIFYESVGGFSMPETVFFDAEGNISFHARGPMRADQIQSQIEAIRNATNE